MTICNMCIEGGARAGLIAPDDTTFEYVRGRPPRPAGRGLGRGGRDAGGRCPPTTARPTTSRSRIDAGALEPMITYGTNPGMGMPDHRPRAPPRGRRGRRQPPRRSSTRSSTWASQPGQRDRRPAGRRRVHRLAARTAASATCASPPACSRAATSPTGCALMVVPGSQQVKAQAEREGLDEIFRAAGAEWREAGCSMCIAMNGDQLSPGQYAVSTRNRNFEGRQGKGGRTFLASPLTAAATAITGVVTDPRTLPGVEDLVDRRRRVLTMAEAFRRFSRGRAAARRERGHRPDHPGPLPQDDRQGGPRGRAVPRLALRGGRLAEGPAVRARPARRCRAARSCSRATTSAPARRASTRRGRSARGASGRSSRPRSPTSSAATPSRTACCRSSSTRRRTRALFELVERRPGRRAAGRPRRAGGPAARRHRRSTSTSTRSRKMMLLAGTDEIGYVLGDEDARSSAWEARNPARVDTRLGTRAAG